jgi:PKD repeat protein
MGDLDGDGLVEVYAAGHDGGIYGYDTDLGWRLIDSHPGVSWRDGATARWTGAARDAVLFVGTVDGGTFKVVSLTAESANNPPVAQAGGPYSVSEGTSVFLNGSGSDPDGDPLTFAWDIDNDGTFEAPGQNVTFSAGDLDGPSGQTVVLQVCDTSDACDTDSTTVNITNADPGIISVINDGPIGEGSGATVTVTATDPAGDNDPLSFEFDCDNDGTYEISPQPSNSASCAFADNGAYQVNVRVTDDDGGEASDATTVAANNVAPTVDTPSVTPETSDEGNSVTASATFGDPGVNDAPFICTVNYGDGSGDLQGTVSGNICTGPACIYADNDSYPVTVSVTDKDSGTGTSIAATHVVNNVAPTVGAISAPIDPVRVDTEISVSADFTDPGVLDTHTAEWNWGDGSTSPGTVTETDGSGNVSGSHTYTMPGVYTVKLTVTDKDGDPGQSIHQYVVVYDPEGGFLTGGGWIDSPEGACQLTDACTDATGKANFGFVSKYKKGSNVPTGETEFQFKAGNLNFHSDSYEWLVVAGHRAKYKGEGTINGIGNYGFMLSAIDEKLTPSTDVDLFRIKIWDKDYDDLTVYDNQMEADEDADPATAIGGGNIVIHKAK